MGVYDYKAVNSVGKKVKGRMEASNQEEVIRRLGNQGISVESVIENKMAMNIVIGSGVKKKELIMFYRQMSNLVETGVPLSRSIGLIAEQTKNTYFKSVLYKINDDIQVGIPLSKSMEKHEKVFEETTISQIRAAEDGGFLQKTLKELGVQTKREMEFNKKVKSSMMYPIFIIFLTVLVVAGMVLFIIPKMSEALTSMDADMPFLTQLLIDVSAFAQEYILVILGIIFAIVITFLIFYKKTKFRMKVDTNILKIPIFGSLIININVARIVRTMSSLLESGISLETTMTNVIKVVKNVKLRQTMEEVKEEMVTKGYLLSRAIENRKIYPNTLIQVISIGEETGNLPDVLIQLSEQYEEEVQENLETMIGIINPTMMLVIAGVIGVVVIGLFSPMFSMMDNIG